MQKLYYAALRHSKEGPKKQRYTHLLIIPTIDNEYLYLGVTGKLIDVPNCYTCQLIVRLPENLLPSILDGEKEQFEERFEILEKVGCSIDDGRAGEYSIKLDHPGKYIRSNIKVSVNEELSCGSKKTYILSGIFNLIGE